MPLKLALLAGLLSIELELPSDAHDIYSHLSDSKGVSCCNEYDRRPAPYRVTPTGVQMFVYGDWIDVPDDKIQYRALPNDTGETAGGHWCGRPRDWQSPRVVLTYCAVLPPNSSIAAYPHLE
jgi:hypothetical protein